MNHSGSALINPVEILNNVIISEGMRVADFGCGRTGHIAFQLATKVGERGIVYALDIMKDVLANITSHARSNGFTNIQTIWSDLEQVGKAAVPAASLDAGFFVNSFFVFKNRVSALREAARLIKDGGYLVVVDWLKKLGPLGPTAEQLINFEELCRMAKSEGFIYHKDFTVGEYHFCGIFIKKSV